MSNTPKKRTPRKNKNVHTAPLVASPRVDSEQNAAKISKLLGISRMDALRAKRILTASEVEEAANCPVPKSEKGTNFFQGTALVAVPEWHQAYPVLRGGDVIECRPASAATIDRDAHSHVALAWRPLEIGGNASLGLCPVLIVGNGSARALRWTEGPRTFMQPLQDAEIAAVVIAHRFHNSQGSSSCNYRQGNDLNFLPDYLQPPMTFNESVNLNDPALTAQQINYALATWAMENDLAAAVAELPTMPARYRSMFHATPPSGIPSGLRLFAFGFPPCNDDCLFLGRRVEGGEVGTMRVDTPEGTFMLCGAIGRYDDESDDECLRWCEDGLRLIDGRISLLSDGEVG